MPYQVSMMG